MMGTARTGDSIISTRLLKVTIYCLVFKTSENTENTHHNFPEAKTTYLVCLLYLTNSPKQKQAQAG